MGDGFGAWFESLLRSVDENHFTAMVAIMYHIWLQRNSAVWDYKVGLPWHVHATAVASFDAWRKAVGTEPRQHEASAPTVAVGQSTGQLFCYFDAAYVAPDGEGAYGLVLQHAGGEFFAAKNGLLPPCHGPFMAESYACKESLSWLRERGVMEVVLRTDCLNLRHTLSSSAAEFHSYDGVAVSACRDLMSLLHSCSIICIPRSSNVLAHSLAQAALSQANSMAWEDVPPAFISTLVD
ncbi:PREDICTED: uncharacterized protein LOC109189547 [Ipomoea nil]|uniref:uncharacterized protein LOC109189547 n=1 Tax=Ipomoea nil TaxID=35883 RepID=UPI000901E226|nr:PREDICTED: uncharacterized protein LOC109189547 [Ipomoea nil]